MASMEFEFSTGENIFLLKPIVKDPIVLCPITYKFAQ